MSRDVEAVTFFAAHEGALRGDIEYGPWPSIRAGAEPRLLIFHDGERSEAWWMTCRQDSGDIVAPASMEAS